MDTQNVSAQLYFEQLPLDPNAGSFNCETVPEGLSTCVDPVSSDAQIERAFQEQLNLSLYYKDPVVFETMKSTFMDQTMENKNTPIKRFAARKLPKPPSVPINIPSGPEDILKSFVKESFGGSSYYIPTFIIIIAVLLSYYFLT